MHCFLAVPHILFRQLRMLLSTSPLNGFHNLETTPFQNLPESFHHTVRLIIENIERIRGSTSAYHNRFLTLMKRKGHSSGVLPHHAVNHTVEKHFHFSRHVSPIARSTDYQCIDFLHRLQHSLCPILGQTTLQ